MPKHLFHRFSVESPDRLLWVALHQEQMDAVWNGERRVSEGMPHRSGALLHYVWWYFNDNGRGSLRVEIGSDADAAVTVWEGRIQDAYTGRLCSAQLL